jgi:hypothetical protein
MFPGCFGTAVHQSNIGSSVYQVPSGNADQLAQTSGLLKIDLRNGIAGGGENTDVHEFWIFDFGF